MSDPLEQPQSAPSASSPPANPNLLDESPIAPQTEENQPTMGTKLFVLFFFLIVPPLGVVLLVTLCWTMWKAFNA